jgi:hypothetical protein
LHSSTDRSKQTGKQWCQVYETFLRDTLPDAVTVFLQKDRVQGMHR